MIEMMEIVMRHILAAAAVVVSAGMAMASDGDIVRVQAAHDVPTTMDRLEAAVTAAGAKVAARVDHAGAAQSVDMTLAPAQVLIFGNPKIGTPAMQDNPLAGLYLPLKVLVYEDAEGQTWLAYEAPAAMLDDLDGVADDAAYLTTMAGALGNLTAKAAAAE